ncbi:hypothetical protein MVEN_01331400 [Mycena venus]|uniref:DUF6699 domain-containing protein n=1 Tax=Mycena venus TaxID=2733690 RepID=A0A8H7CTX0_9AGAR|nr:hypothetical protein MVEN_01331400 [Mycena venus]
MHDRQSAFPASTGRRTLFDANGIEISGPYISVHDGLAVAFPASQCATHRRTGLPWTIPPGLGRQQVQSLYAGVPHPHIPSAIPLSRDSHQRSGAGVPRLAGMPDTQPHPQSHRRRPTPIPLPPQLEGVTSVTLHPALAKASTRLVNIDFASLALPMADAETNAALPWFHLLSSTPATSPPLPSLTIESPRLPWAITAHPSGRVARVLTVADVIGAIQSALCLPIDAEQFLDWEIMMRSGSRWPGRRSLRHQNAMTRLDLLEGKTRFAGLYESTMGCDVWVLEVA